MTSLQDFLPKLAETLLADASRLGPETELSSLAGWDSMGQVSVISLLDEIGAKPPPGALQKSRTVADILKLAGVQ